MNDYDPSSDFDFPAPSIDPHSPERKKAAGYARAAVVCRVLTYVFFGAAFIGVAVTKGTVNTPVVMLSTLPFLLASVILYGVFKNKDLRIRCTQRTTACCIDTVHRRSGKYLHRYPVVEYEVDGVHYTAELHISCGRHAVGETYTIYYDPLDPHTVLVK